MNLYDYSGLSFQHIQYFITIAEQGTMNKAAEVLHVSPSLLSQKMAQLEKMICIRLFERSRQRLYLTEAGKQLLVDLKDIQSSLNFVLDSARERFCTRHELTIGLTNYQDNNFVDFILDEVQKMCPDLNFKVEIQPRAQLQADFLDRKLDIICVTDFDQIHKDPAVRSKIAFEASVGCYMNANSPIGQSRSELGWKDLDGADCILPQNVKDTPFFRDIKRKIRGANVNISIQFHYGDVLTINRLITVNNSITFARYRRVDTDKLKCFIMPDLSYPFIVAWHQDAGEDISKYADALHGVISENITAFQ